MRTVIAATLLLLTAGTATAQEPPIDQSKLYLSSPEACAAAEAGTMGEDFQNLRFKDGAIQFSEEAYCSFYQVLSNPWQPDLIVTALCDFGGSKFIDTLRISRVDDETMDVWLQSEIDAANFHNATQEISAESPAAEAVPTTFTRCNLDDLPRP